MSHITATAQADTHSGRPKAGQGLWAPVLAGWALCALPALAGLWLDGGPPKMSPDDAMRLVQVRDLLSGQGWFDPVQARLGLDGGTVMHWSRLVDLPIAFLIALLSPLLGQGGAEVAVTIAWPLVTLLPAVLVMAAAARRLGGRDAAWAAALLAGAALAHSGKYVPGALDHHNVQLTLLAVCVSGLVLAPVSARWAAIAGAAMAASVAVGAERLPVLGAMGAAFALAWAIVPAVMARAAIALGLSLSGALAGLFAVSAPMMAYRGGYCDAISLDMALPILLGALGLTAAALAVSSRPVAFRIGALAAVGGSAAGAAALLAPACFSNPYAALDPFLREMWLDNVAETRTLAESLVDVPGLFVPALLSGAAGLVAAIVLMMRGGPARAGWAVMIAGLVAALTISAFQLRGISALAPFAVLPVAILAASLFAASGNSRSRGLCAIALVVLAMPGATAPLVHAAAGDASSDSAVDDTGPAHDLWSCYEDGTYAPLAALPQGVISAASNLGAHILLESPHRVLAAPYHRNEAGMIAQLRIARAEPADAEALLMEHDVDYFVVCRGDPETTLTEESTHPGLVPALSRGDVPSFLTRLPVPEGSRLDIYAVTPG